MSQIDIFDEIIVDNFAGGGGASTGIELAAGRPVAMRYRLHLQRLSFVQIGRRLVENSWTPWRSSMMPSLFERRIR